MIPLLLLEPQQTDLGRAAAEMPVDLPPKLKPQPVNALLNGERVEVIFDLDNSIGRLTTRPETHVPTIPADLYIIEA